MAWSLLGANPLPEPIFILSTNKLHCYEHIAVVFSRLKKKTDLEMICKIVVILSRPQCVEHGIDLYRYHYSQSCEKHQKSYISSRTLLSRLSKPVAYTDTTCVPDLSIDFVA